MNRTVIIIGGIVAALVIIGLPIALLIWAPTDFLQRASYLAIIVTSVFACGLLVATIALVAAIVALVTVVTNLADNKVSPLLDKVNETMDISKGTIAYVGEGVVSPLIKLGAIVTGVRASAQALFRGGKK